MSGLSEINKQVKTMGAVLKQKNTRSFASARNEAYYNLVCGILEQAFLDWRALEMGDLTALHIDAGYIYRAEVEDFLMSEWFDELLSYALPQYTPQEIREALKVREPERRSKVD